MSEQSENSTVEINNATQKNSSLKDDDIVRPVFIFKMCDYRKNIYITKQWIESILEILKLYKIKCENKIYHVGYWTGNNNNNGNDSSSSPDPINSHNFATPTPTLTTTASGEMKKKKDKSKNAVIGPEDLLDAEKKKIAVVDLSPVFVVHTHRWTPYSYRISIEFGPYWNISFISILLGEHEKKLYVNDFTGIEEFLKRVFMTYTMFKDIQDAAVLHERELSKLWSLEAYKEVHSKVKNGQITTETKKQQKQKEVITKFVLDRTKCESIAKTKFALDLVAKNFIECMCEIRAYSETKLEISNVVNPIFNFSRDTISQFETRHFILPRYICTPLDVLPSGFNETTTKEAENEVYFTSPLFAYQRRMEDMTRSNFTTAVPFPSSLHDNTTTAIQYNKNADVTAIDKLGKEKKKNSKQNKKKTALSNYAGYQLSKRGANAPRFEEDIKLLNGIDDKEDTRVNKNQEDNTQYPNASVTNNELTYIPQQIVSNTNIQSSNDSSYYNQYQQHQQQHQNQHQHQYQQSLPIFYPLMNTHPALTHMYLSNFMPPFNGFHTPPIFNQYMPPPMYPVNTPIPASATPQSLVEMLQKNANFYTSSANTDFSLATSNGSNVNI